ncbi:polymorphic toxin-type HINT domain-containing protein [Neorhodopirellula pilleata]|nr:polymorphic toxin-type HINT domain-containing protein [Neorhodopirellula pilleata]
MAVPSADDSPVLTGSICAPTVGHGIQNPTQAADDWFAQLGRSDSREIEDNQQPVSSIDANVSLEPQAECHAATSHSVCVPTDSPDHWNETQQSVAKTPRSARFMPALIALMLCIAFGAWGWWSQTPSADALVTTEVRQVEASSPAGLQPKRIEQIEVGDHVWARDPVTGELALRRVEAVFHRSSDHLRHLTFTGADGGAQALSTTDEHPFFVVDPSGSTPGIEVTAGELAIGDEVLQLDGTASVVTETRHEVVPGGVPVYNFRVAGFHTYHVSASPRGPPLWVHNAGCEGDPEVFNITPSATKAEVFYRAMSKREYDSLVENGGLTLKQGGVNRELFVTQDLSYAQRLAHKHPSKYEVIVRFNAESGTVAKLRAHGASNNVPGFAALSNGSKNVVHVKLERGVENYGLREETLSIFNNSNLIFGVVE